MNTHGSCMKRNICVQLAMALGCIYTWLEHCFPLKVGGYKYQIWDIYVQSEKQIKTHMRDSIMLLSLLCLSDRALIGASVL